MRIAMILTGALAATMVVAPAQAKTPTCHGEKATISKHRGKVTGTAKRDVIVLKGRGTVRAKGGDDLICGSDRRDRIHGGPGRDHIYGGGRADVLRGGAGADRLAGEGGPDRLHGGSGPDRMYGGPGRDTPVAMTSADFYAATGFLLDVNFTQAGLQSLLESGQAVGLAKQPDIAGGKPLLWSSWMPSLDNDVNLLNDVGVYFGQGALMPGVTVTPSGMIQAQLGDIVGLGMAFQQPVSGGNPKAVTIDVESFTDADFVGAAAMASVNGQQSPMNPTSAAPVMAGLSIEITPSDTVQIFATWQGTMTGQVLDDTDLEQATAVEFSADTPTRTLNYDAATGRFRLVD